MTNFEDDRLSDDREVTTEEAEHWLLNSCPLCLCDPCSCMAFIGSENDRTDR